jgi:hypothetical protein
MSESDISQDSILPAESQETIDTSFYTWSPSGAAKIQKQTRSILGGEVLPNLCTTWSEEGWSEGVVHLVQILGGRPEEQHIRKLLDRLGMRSEIRWLGTPNRAYAEPDYEEIEDFLAMLRFEQRSKLAELDLE